MSNRRQIRTVDEHIADIEERLRRLEYEATGNSFDLPPPTPQAAAHTHDADPANTTIIGGVAENAPGVPTIVRRRGVAVGDYAYIDAEGSVVIGPGFSETLGDHARASGAVGDVGLNVVITGNLQSVPGSVYENASTVRGYSDIAVGSANETGSSTLGQNIIFGNRNEVTGNGLGNILIGDGDIGDKNHVAGGDLNILIGDLGLYLGGDDGIGIGINVVIDDGVIDAIAMGDGTIVEDDFGIGIGSGTWVKAGHTRSAALGDGATTSAADQLALATDWHIEFDELSADPPTPAAGKVRFYAKDSGGVAKLFYIDSGGTVTGPLT